MVGVKLRQLGVDIHPTGKLEQNYLTLESTAKARRNIHTQTEPRFVLSSERVGAVPSMQSCRGNVTDMSAGLDIHLTSKREENHSTPQSTAQSPTTLAAVRKQSITSKMYVGRDLVGSEKVFGVLIPEALMPRDSSARAT